MTKSEKQKRLKGVGTAHRPIDVSHWINRGRPLNKPPSIADLSTFGLLWKRWYTALMPDWRCNGDHERWPLLTEVPFGDDWSGVKLVGERNGVCMLILSLLWWKHQSKDDPKMHKDYVEAAKDLAWVLPRVVDAGLPVAPHAGDSIPSSARSSTPPLPPPQPASGTKRKPDPVTSSPSPRRSRRKPRK